MHLLFKKFIDNHVFAFLSELPNMLRRENRKDLGEVCTRSSGVRKLTLLILKFVWNSHDTHVASSPRKTGEERQVSWTLHEEKREF